MDPKRAIRAGTGTDLALEDRIHLAELAVIRRDERLRASVAGMRAEIDQAARSASRSLGWIATGCGLALLAWKLVRSGKSSGVVHAPRAELPVQLRSGLIGRLPWRWIALRLWPLVPDRVRARIGARTVMVLSLLPPAVAALARWWKHRRRDSGPVRS